MKKETKQKTDIELGMKKHISRRDVLHGFGVLSATALTTSFLSACSSVLDKKTAYNADFTPINITTPSDQFYPPAKTGLRGNHQGSFEVAHQLGRENKRDWGPVIEPDADLYDLVVQGSMDFICF